jgi:ribonuclease P protein component
VERLKRRADFLAAAKGRKVARSAFLLQARDRGDDGPPRFGFTVSKRIAAKAVERNRIRRRLRETVRLVGQHRAARGYDYVLVARRPALHMPFAHLTEALAQSLKAVGAGRPAREPGRGDHPDG